MQSGRAPHGSVRNPFVADPFEAHTLKFRLVSFYSLEFVKLNLTQPTPVPSTTPTTLPPSWDLLRDFVCVVGETGADEAVRSRGDSTFRYSYVECSVRASRVDIDWFFHDFFFFLCIIIANLFASLVIPAAVTEPSDLPERLNVRSVNSAALCLAYAATLGETYRPYGQPTSSFEGSLPISYWIYTIGLITLASSFVYSA